MTLARLLALGGISVTMIGCAAFNYVECEAVAASAG